MRFVHLVKRVLISVLRGLLWSPAAPENNTWLCPPLTNQSCRDVLVTADPVTPELRAKGALKLRTVDLQFVSVIIK